MPTYSDLLQTRVTENTLVVIPDAAIEVEAEPSVLSGPPVVGINPLFLPIIEALMLALTQFMQGCLDKVKNKKAVAKKRTRLGFFQRYSLNLAILMQPALKNYKEEAIQILTKTIEESEESEAVGLMTEMEQEIIMPFTPFGHIAHSYNGE